MAKISPDASEDELVINADEEAAMDTSVYNLTAFASYVPRYSPDYPRRTYRRAPPLVDSPWPNRLIPASQIIYVKPNSPELRAEIAKLNVTFASSSLIVGRPKE